MNHVVVWFEIPVKNMERAKAFYSQVFAIEMHTFEKEDVKMAFFPYEQGTASGSLVEAKNHHPSEQGTLIYLNGGQDLTTPLSRVEKAGGKVLEGKRSIEEHGFIAIFLDTEGNRVALHSMQ